MCSPHRRYGGLCGGRGEGGRTDADVAAAVELAVDVHLGEGGPGGVDFHTLPEALVLQDVDGLIRNPDGVEDLHHGVGEAALGLLLGALDEAHDLVLGDELVDGALHLGAHVGGDAHHRRGAAARGGGSCRRRSAASTPHAASAVAAKGREGAERRRRGRRGGHACVNDDDDDEAEPSPDVRCR